MTSMTPAPDTLYTTNVTPYTPFTNSLYDSCNLDKKNQESTGPFNWMTDPNIKESSQACHVGFSPFMQNQFNSVPFNKIDAESELRNQTRKLSRCPTTQFDPTKFTPINNDIKDCTTNDLVPTYTRLNKACNLPGVSINRFVPLCDDPQNLLNIHANSYIGRNTRLQVKDDYKTQLEENPIPRGTFNNLPLNEAINRYTI